jgi:hypothetical protein
VYIKGDTLCSDTKSIPVCLMVIVVPLAPVLIDSFELLVLVAVFRFQATNAIGIHAAVEALSSSQCVHSTVLYPGDESLKLLQALGDKVIFRGLSGVCKTLGE